MAVIWLIIHKILEAIVPEKRIAELAGLYLKVVPFGRRDIRRSRPKNPSFRLKTLLRLPLRLKYRTPFLTPS